MEAPEVVKLNVDVFVDRSQPTDKLVDQIVRLLASAGLDATVEVVDRE